jgi:hypothetical protein
VLATPIVTLVGLTGVALLVQHVIPEHRDTVAHKCRAIVVSTCYLYALSRVVCPPFIVRSCSKDRFVSASGVIHTPEILVRHL